MGIMQCSFSLVRAVVITRLQMFVQGTQTQVKRDTYLARLYLSASLLPSRDTVTLPSSIVNFKGT